MSKSILVIEDDADLRAGVSDLLTGEGYKVTLAKDGQEGWEILKANPTFNAILLDYTMPRLDAKGFRELQRNEPKLSKIPVILFSAAVLNESTIAAIAPTVLIRKPVDIDVLLNTIQELTEKSAC